MIVLDAYPVLALLKGEPAAEAVLQLLDGEEETALTATGVAEIVDHLVRIAGADEDEAVLDLAQLGLGAATPVAAGTAIAAGLLRARHYDRRHRAVSLADCVVAATALEAGACVATADPHLLDLCAAEGIEVLVLPDSAGRSWPS